MLDCPRCNKRWDLPLPTDAVKQRERLEMIGLFHSHILLHIMRLLDEPQAGDRGLT